MVRIDYNIFYKTSGGREMPRTEEIKKLVATLKEDDRSKHEQTRYALIQIGKEATPYLIELLEHSNHHTRWEAVKALGGIKDPKAAPALVEALMDDSIEIHWAASEALIALGKSAMPSLLKGITRHFDSYRFRHGAYHILHAFDSKHLLDEDTRPVFESLRTIEPSVSAPWAAEAALEALEQKK
jgi:HEAT repeat protein